MLKGRCGLPARTALHCLEAALVLKRRCGLPARTAPYCLEAALVLKVRCGLPARTACKKLRCSKTAAGWQPAPLAGNSGAQKPLRTASLHRLEAALVLKRRYGRAAWKQLWCSKHRCGLCRCRLLARTAAHCLEAALVFKDRRAVSPRRFEAVLVFKGR